MLSHILKYISYPKKGQVTVYIFTVMASLIVAAFMVINIGKTAKDKTYSDNAADAGALATCSIMSQCFNYIAQQNDNQSDKKTGSEGQQQSNRDNIGNTGNQTAERPITSKYTQKNAGDSSTANGHIQGTANSKYPDSPQDLQGQHEGQAIQNSEQSSHDDVKETRENQQERTKDAMKAANGDDTGDPNNYYDKAISEGYKICFQNAGVHHRLGKLGSKMYEQFQKTLEPGEVQSGEPRTFFWVDGAGRAHMVTCIIDTEEPDKWNMNESQDNRQTTDQKFEKLDIEAKTAQGQYGTASGGHATGAGMPDSIDIPSFGTPNDATANLGNNNLQQANTDSKSITQGLQSNQQKMATNSSQLQQDQIKSVQDVQHSTTVRAMNFQFHMGSPVKSIIGDIDVMTFYPPVQSSAIASFNYSGRGKINRGNDSGSDANYECGLVSAF